MANPHVVVWHSLTVIPQSSAIVPAPVDGAVEAADDIAIEQALNFIQTSGGTVFAVLPIACINPISDEQGFGHFHWIRIVYTT